MTDFIRLPPKLSSLESRFWLFWHSIEGHQPLQREVRFNGDRKWRFDFANVEARVAFELEGGIFVGGRHTRAIGFSNDCEKYNEAILCGWDVFRLTKAQIEISTLTRFNDFIIQKIKEKENYETNKTMA